MADVKLQKSWSVSRTLLERARRALPVGSEQEYVNQLARYREFLEHYEFEIALDTLEELGHLVSCRGVTVMEVKGNQVRIGFKATRDVEVHREEVYDRVQNEKAQQAE
jgi:Global regulator protein family